MRSGSKGAAPGSGARLGVSRPAFPHETLAATRSRSYTVTRAPLSRRNQAVAGPTSPATPATSRGAPVRDEVAGRRRAACQRAPVQETQVPANGRSSSRSSGISVWQPVHRP
jgi:hypothetical protein